MVLNILCSFGMLEKIVEICMKVRLVFCVSSWVMVVLLMLGGFYRISDDRLCVVSIVFSGLLGLRMFFCLMILVSCVG